MQLLASLGLGLRKIIGLHPIRRVSPKSREQERFLADFRQELVKLKEKGLSIPVFTL